ncbi:MAG: autotransporter adhesin family protein [Roseburia sp.]|nr:autotransporter adhesin family protein [Roseburia sp.]
MRTKLFSRRRVLAFFAMTILLCAAAFFALFAPDKKAEAADNHTTILGANTAISSGGSYYLNADITRNITVSSGTVNICLNGHTLTGTGTSSVITVGSGATLNLYDCSDDHTGEITGGHGTGTTTTLGGGLHVTGTLNIYGGNITGNTASYGGGIQADDGAVITMYGGTISGNTATGDGAGVNASGGGTGSTFTLKDGEISGNTATGNGGGIHMSYNGKVVLEGGTISGNTAGSNGGGINYASNDSDSLSVKGAPVVYGNTNSTDSSASNVYIASGKYIKVAGALTAGAKIGVSAAGTGVATGYNTYNSGVSPSEYFSSDSSTLAITTASGNVVLQTVTSTDVTAFSNRTWRANGASNLAGGTLYVYANGSDEKVYTAQQATAPAGYTYSGTRAVTASAATYTGSAITVAVASNAAQDAYYTIGTYSGNTGTEVGKYTATVVLTAKSGMQFINGANTTSLNYIDTASGLSVDIAPDRLTATVTKVWYIVGTSGESNALLAPTSASGVATAYTVDDWTYGDNSAPAVPRLKYGDDGASWDSAQNVRFSLRYGSDPIASTFYKENFTYYINKSMPAGTYTLTVSADAVTTASGTAWWGGAAAAVGVYNDEYTFTVNPATITLALGTPTADGYMSCSWQYDAEDKGAFFAEFETRLNTPGVLSSVSVTREGYWATSVADGYFGDYEFKYNFTRLHSSEYLASSSGGIRDNITYGANGTYRVYFRVEKPNHAPTSTDNFYTVTVYKSVSAPVVPAVVYTGQRVTPNVPADADAAWTVTYDSGDAYTIGGTHYISVTLNDSEHYRWAQGTSVLPTDSATARVTFTISKAANVWKQTPNIVGWDYGTFKKDVNKLQGVPQYLDDGQSVHFGVATNANGTSYVQGLDDFTAVEGVVSDQIATLLNGLKSGKYYLITRVIETANYQGISSQAVEFEVSPAANSWNTQPTIATWVKGSYDSETNAVVFDARYGNDNVIILIRDNDGKVYYNSVTGTNDLDSAPAGSYILIANIAGCGDYEGLDYSISFRIFEKPGLPWWVILLIVLGILLVIFLVVLILYKKGVLQLVTEKMVVAIRTRADSDATIAAVRAGKIAAEAERAAEAARIAEAALAVDDETADAEEAQPEVADENEETVAYEAEEGDAEVPSSEGFKKAFAAGSAGQVKYGKTVLSKLIDAPDAVKVRYSDLKNYLLSYKKARANMSRARESFYIGRKCYARIVMRGKTLCLYLADDPQKYEGTKYSVENASAVKTYADTPLLFRIRSGRALKYAKELVDELMPTIDAVKIERKPEDYAALFQSIELLQKKKLISYDGKKQRADAPKGDDGNV